MRFVDRSARLLPLLAACALAGCPAPRPVSEPAPATAPAEAALAAAPVQRSAAAPCPALPPGLEPGTVGGPWNAFEAWLEAKADFGFELTATRSVPLCTGCPSVDTEIVSETQTRCLKPDGLGSQPLLLGMLRVKPGTAWNPSAPAAGDSLFLFASDSLDVVVVYRDGERAMALAQYTWTFLYCEHPSPVPPLLPAAEWRDRNTRTMERIRDDQGNVQLSYGWMACANGCCQFYGPPPANTAFAHPDPRPDRGRDYFIRLGGDCDALAGGHASGARHAPPPPAGGS